MPEQEKTGREIHYQLRIDKIKEIDTWQEQFRNIREDRFSQLDDVLSNIKNKSK